MLFKLPQDWEQKVIVARSSNENLESAKAICLKDVINGFVHKLQHNCN
jgi:hypothetical protein